MAIRSVPAVLKVPTVRTPCTLSWTWQREERRSCDEWWVLCGERGRSIYLLIHLMPYHIISYHIIWHGMSSYEYILFEFTDKYSVIVNLTMLRKALSNSSSSSVARMRSSMRAASLSDNSSSCNTVQQAMEAQEWGSCKDREEGGGERGGWRERGGG